MRPRLLAFLVVTLVAAAAPVPDVVAVTAGERSSAAGFARPVPGAVLAPFDAPTRYGPGHRGVDLAAPLGSAVRAAAAGRVTFAGRVVDATWVTIDHGVLRTTVGPLHAVAVARGEAVVRGAVIGTSGHAHGRPAVHWSVRRGGTYLDPLEPGLDLVPRVASLLSPWPEGWPTRPWPRPRVR